MSIEAMKQALEALDAPSSPMLRIIQEEAITSLRQALSEAQLSVNENSHAIKQAEKQEPFAYLDPGLGAFYWAREYPDGPPPGFEPVYLAGSNKRWVGLTDAEIEEFDYDFRDLVMDIEKLLMERNS